MYMYTVLGFENSILYRRKCFPDKNGRNPLSSMIYRFFAGTLLVRKNVLGSFVNNTLHRKTCFFFFFVIHISSFGPYSWFKISLYIQRNQCYELKRHDIGWDKILWVKLTRVDIRFNEVFVGYIVLFLTRPGINKIF